MWVLQITSHFSIGESVIWQFFYDSPNHQIEILAKFSAIQYSVVLCFSVVIFLAVLTEHSNETPGARKETFSARARTRELDVIVVRKGRSYLVPL